MSNVKRNTCANAMHEVPEELAKNLNMKLPFKCKSTQKLAFNYISKPHSMNKETEQLTTNFDIFLQCLIYTLQQDTNPSRKLLKPSRTQHY